ncbi:hypothetical protein ACP70R_020815 [Stipagrostis hirtigluma subsp. patula]
MGNSLVWSRSSSNDSHPRPVNRKRKLNDQIGQENNVICKVAPESSYPEPIHKRRRVNELENIPEDVLSTILSKLPLKEYRGRVVEELAIKFEFDSMLIDHLNNWVSFAVSSWTKFLALDLAPTSIGHCHNAYIFPFELMDSESLARLQRIQLSFVCLKPPNQFSGFPNLKKLALHAVRANGKDFQSMLSNCCSLEVLILRDLFLYDELMVDHPLPRLLYLSVKWCKIDGIVLDSVKLTTFVYAGRMVPIDLSKASELKNVDISFYMTTLEHVINKFPNTLPNMIKMTLCANFKYSKVDDLLDRKLMQVFSAEACALGVLI